MISMIKISKLIIKPMCQFFIKNKKREYKEPQTTIPTQNSATANKAIIPSGEKIINIYSKSPFNIYI